MAQAFRPAGTAGLKPFYEAALACQSRWSRLLRFERLSGSHTPSVGPAALHPAEGRGPHASIVPVGSRPKVIRVPGTARRLILLFALDEGAPWGAGA